MADARVAEPDRCVGGASEVPLPRLARLDVDVVARHAVERVVRRDLVVN